MNCPDFAGLDRWDMESLFYAIDGSLKVQRRFQFFLWSQGGLQGPLPHEAVICAWGELENARFKYETFSRSVLPPEFAASLADPVDGLLARLVGEWLRRSRQPCVYVAGSAEEEEEGGCPAPLRAVFRRHGLQRVVAHGPRETKGEGGSFFVFLNGGAAYGPRDAYYIEMLMPHLHMALHRIAMQDGDESYVDEVAADAVLSEREVQVLKWVRDGKTNQEIALILELSPLTVKNHVQKILRKLKVNNRAQAVAKGIATRLITDRALV